MVVNLEPLLAHLPVWLLVLFRLTGIFLYAPLFGSVTIPGRVKVFLALGLSFCVYPMLLDPARPSAMLLAPVIASSLSLWSLASNVGAELAIGLVIGFGATLPLLAMQWAGRVMGQQIGFGLAEVLSAEKEQGGLLSELYFLFALFVFLNLGGHHILLRTIIGTFDSVPLGGFRVDGAVIDLILGLLTSMLHLAFRVAAPLLCLVFLETVAMGFIARTVPQMNILSIGFALRIVIGVTLIIGALSVKGNILVQFLGNMLGQISKFFA